MRLHKEGHLILLALLIGISVIIAALYAWVPQNPEINALVAVVLIGLFLFVLQFFRNPAIKINMQEFGILAPADGKVVVVEKALETEVLKEERIQISIFMSPVNVHINRTPVAGKVSYLRYHRGKYLVAWHPKTSTENERTTIVIDHQPTGIPILFRQIAGAMARRIKYYIDEGQQVAQGEECGFIKFGSRVDVLVPLNAEIKVRQGDKTRAGQTLLAVLKK